MINLLFLHLLSFSSDEISLIVSSHQPKRSNNAKNKAALFVRNRAKHFRKKNNKNDNTVVKTETEKAVNNVNDATRESTRTNEKDSAATSIQSPTNSNNTSSILMTLPESNNNGDKTFNLRTKELRWKQSRYLWKNARKRMNYVVGFIRKKDDDEVMLIDESDRSEFTNYKLTVTMAPRRHSFSSVYETASSSLNIDNGDDDNEDIDFTDHTQNTMNQMYLSPQGVRIQNAPSESRFSLSRNSHRSSRRSSLDSSIGPMNSFISQMYLKKSQSNYSVSSIGLEETADDVTTEITMTTTEVVIDDNKKEELFEECFFHSDSFQHDGDLKCIGNQLYDSIEEDIGNHHSDDEHISQPATTITTTTSELSKYGHQEFHISENDIRDIVNEEVNSYLDDSTSMKKSKKAARRGSLGNPFHNHSNDNSFIKQSSAFSYSVNDLYDLFANKENSSSSPKKLNSMEVHFDDLVV